MPKRGASVVTPDVLETLCTRIADGRTLRDVCRDKDMPSHEGVYNAMRRHPQIADAIARARIESAHGLADSVVEIAHSTDDPAMAQLIRNRCEQRRWLAGKFNPMYADRQTIEHRHEVDTAQLGYAELMALAASKSPLTIEHDAGSPPDGGDGE